MIRLAFFPNAHPMVIAAVVMNRKMSVWNLSCWRRYVNEETEHPKKRQNTKTIAGGGSKITLKGPRSKAKICCSNFDRLIPYSNKPWEVLGFVRKGVTYMAFIVMKRIGSRNKGRKEGTEDLTDLPVSCWVFSRPLRPGKGCFYGNVS
jgi:hypothetical protein